MEISRAREASGEGFGNRRARANEGLARGDRHRAVQRHEKPTVRGSCCAWETASSLYKSTKDQKLQFATPHSSPQRFGMNGIAEPFASLGELHKITVYVPAKWEC